MTDLKNLASTLDSVWARLSSGTSHSAKTARTVVLATTGQDGPEARTVVVRAAERETATIEIHTDARSAKVAALELDPRAEILAWYPEDQLQVRLAVQVTLLQGDLQRWNAVPLARREAYGGEPAPGVPIPEPIDRFGSDLAAHMTLICSVKKIDTVFLGPDLHRRAVFQAPKFEGRWLGP